MQIAFAAVNGVKSNSDRSEHLKKNQKGGYRFNGYAVNAGTFADAGEASGTEDPCTLTMPGQEVTVTAELAFADGLGAVAGQSISLDGDIGINFYMELSEEVSANESAYMLFTIPAGGKTETKL